MNSQRIDLIWLPLRFLKDVSVIDLLWFQKPSRHRKKKTVQTKSRSVSGRIFVRFKDDNIYKQGRQWHRFKWTRSYSTISGIIDYYYGKEWYGCLHPSIVDRVTKMVWNFSRAHGQNDSIGWNVSWRHAAQSIQSIRVVTKQVHIFRINNCCPTSCLILFSADSPWP